jgi:teichuronic acid exporter
LIIISIIVTIRWGITILLVGQIIVAIIAYGLNSYYTKRLIGYSTIQQIRDLSPSFGISLVTGVGMFFIGNLSNQLLPVLAIQSLGGISIYLVLNYLFYRNDLIEIISLARQAFRIQMVS